MGGCSRTVERVISDSELDALRGRIEDALPAFKPLQGGKSDFCFLGKFVLMPGQKGARGAQMGGMEHDETSVPYSLLVDKYSNSSGDASILMLSMEFCS